MMFVSVLIALLTIMAAGFGASCLLFKRGEAVPAVEALPLAWLLGTAFISLSLACMGTVASGLVLQGIVAGGCAILGVAGVRAWREKRLQISFPKPAGPLEWMLCLVLLVEFAMVIRLQYREGLGWDGILLWEIKARYAFLNGGVIPKAYFMDETRVWSQPSYPLLFPLTETWLYLWMGDCNQNWVRVIFPVFYGAAALLLCAGVRRLTGKRWAGLATAAMLFTLPGIWNFLSGYVDFPLAVFYLAAVIYFLRHQRGNAPSSHLVFFSILAGLLPWVKREGAILWFCLMVIAGCEFLRRREFRRALIIPLPGVLILAGWKIAMLIVKTPPYLDFLRPTLGAAWGNRDRLGPVFATMARYLVETGFWGLLWVAFPAALVFLAVRSQRKMSAFLFLTVALPLGIDGCLYLLSAEPSYVTHIQTSLQRLIMDVSLSGLLTVALAAAGDAQGE